MTTHPGKTLRLILDALSSEGDVLIMCANEDHATRLLHQIDEVTDRLQIDTSCPTTHRSITTPWSTITTSCSRDSDTLLRDRRVLDDRA